MPTNGIKYSVTPQTEALKKGNFWISTGDVDKGPTPSSGYYISITPPSGGYSVYLNKPSDGPSIYTPPNDNDLIVLAQGLAGQTFATGASALNWFASQTDKMACNIDYPPVITNGLVLNYDAGFTPSYPRTGNTWYDLGTSSANGSLINGPTFNIGSGGSIVFDGADDYIQLVNSASYKTQFPISVGVWFKSETLTNYGVLIRNDDTSSSHWGVSLVVNSNYTLGAGYGNGTVNDAPGRRSYVSSVAVNLSQWYNFTVVFPDNLTCNGYLNGQSISMPYTSGGATTLAYGSGGGTIGFRQDGPGLSYFKGNISTAQIYSRGLSAQEAFQNYQSFLSRFIDPGIVTSGLVLYLDAANPFYAGSGTSWADASGSKNTGSLKNSVSYSAANSGQLVFDGTDDYVNIGINKSCNRFTSDFTVSAWVNRSSSGVQWGNIIGDYYTNSTANPLEWQILMRSDGYLTVYNVSGGFVIGATPSGFGSNTWVNVSLSRIGSTLTLYANSNAIATVTNTTTFGSATGNLNIGIDGNNASEPFTGSIANVFIYKNKGLTAQEVLQNYNAQKSRFGL